MANIVLNIAKGAAAEKVRDGADLIVVLLKAAEADGTLADYDDLAALLAAAGNTEADFTNYGRKTIANAGVTLTVDDVNDRVELDIADQVWASAGGATNNTLAKLLVCMDGASDAARVPLTAHDFVAITDGSELTAQIDAAGFYRAA